ncbi:MAG: hypothetical protein A2W03_14480 [Candidatus Aminicenantes bacterium RBG_16_63_16]|nr:MAG: hypothetical protein A2W03_14480 [Candidatus Aminicenantes bacterium RBG_16_63_16]
MSFPFAWNEFADQPHNVAPRRERIRHHLRHAGGYFSMIATDLAVAVPALKRYRDYLKSMHRRPVDIGSAFGLACSHVPGREDEIIGALKSAGIRQTLVRVPSWERDSLARHAAFAALLRGEGLDVVAALLQRRDDVLDPAGWRGFLADAFSALAPSASHFEVGHAWNRTKWGVWDWREYVALAEPALELAPSHGVRLVGPAVIDFEFHLYPPTLRRLAFDKVSSLLYVDRSGAPESAQFGWTMAKKLALWRAVVDQSLLEPRGCWITEFNWPLEGTGRYSPAPGKPSVSEEAQANYLVRYFVIGASSGLVERMYWWQLAAPGYGLIDSREAEWRRRAGYFALETLVRHVEGSRFEGKEAGAPAEVYNFRKGSEEFAVCWTVRGEVEHVFAKAPRLVVGLDGRERPAGPGRAVRIEERPQYVIFR